MEIFLLEPLGKPLALGSKQMSLQYCFHSLHMQPSVTLYCQANLEYVPKGTELVVLSQLLFSISLMIKIHMSQLDGLPIASN